MSLQLDRIDDFDFQLPEDLIALRPAEPRSSARLLVVNGRTATIEDKHVSDLPSYLTAEDVLALNSTRVIQAALSGTRPSRTPEGNDVQVSINLNRRTSPDTWSVFLRPAKRIRAGDTIALSNGLEAKVETEPEAGECHLKFNASGSELEARIEEQGSTPLPPYILSKRAADHQDRSDYQTSYAEAGESVAAPTAGLHLSTDVLKAITDIGVTLAHLRLDVNAGTFRPMMSESLDVHQMHAERAILTADTANQITRSRETGGRCIAVGTTSMRTLESASASGRLDAFDEETDIFIRPGYSFRTCDGLLTNFHLPKSTLFVLVCAFMGVELMKAAYRHAVENRYRFFSYGDACLLLPNG